MLKTKRINIAQVGSILLVALLIGILFFAGLTAASTLPIADLAQYWAGAHLISTNPYSQNLYLQFDRSQGVVTDGPPMVMRNPPPALLLVLPLRFMNYRAAFAFWDLLSIVILAACGRLAYGLVNSEPSLMPVALSLLFGPSIALLTLGQIAIFALLGISLFLFLIERRKDMWAGAALSLTIVKPHIALLFLVVVVLWSIRNRRWSVLLGTASTLTISTGAVAMINPHSLAQYAAFAAEFSKENAPYPNLGGLLYVLSGNHALAYLPQATGVIWLAFYWNRHREPWDWKTDGMYVLLVSLVCCYYSFPFDQIIILPALMIALGKGNRPLLYSGLVITNLAYIFYISGFIGHLGYGPMFLWWTALGWLATFMLAQIGSLAPFEAK